MSKISTLAFERQVVDAIARLELPHSAPRKVAAVRSGYRPAAKVVRSQKAPVSAPKRITLARKARALLNRPGVKEAICRALRSVSNDARSSGKRIGTVLIALWMAGQLAAPEPFVVAMLAIFISRATIAGFCDSAPKRAPVRRARQQ